MCAITMADNNPSDESPFFELPRELRNMIYDHLRDHCAVIDGKEGNDQKHVRLNGMTATIETVAPHIFLVSKRVAAEVMAQADTSMTLHLTTARPLPQGAPQLPLSLTNKLKGAIFNLTALSGLDCQTAGQRCGAASDIRYHEGWIRDMQHALEDPIPIHVNICIQGCEQEGPFTWPERPHTTILGIAAGKLARDAGITSMSVYRCKSYRVLDLGEVWLSWSEEEGWSRHPLL